MPVNGGRASARPGRGACRIQPAVLPVGIAARRDHERGRPVQKRLDFASIPKRPWSKFPSVPTEHVRMNWARRFPKLAAAVTAFPALVAGAGVVILADFGAPLWVFALLLLWPVTVGLPSTLAVLLMAGLWGWMPWATGLPGFLVASLVAAWGAQWAAVSAWIRLHPGRGESP